MAVAAAPAKWHHEATAQRAGCRAVAGIDEAGRGPWAGPVVAAAVVLFDYTFDVRVDDSKKMTACARERAYTAIRQQAHVGIGIVHRQAIDVMNIVQATLQAMRDALAWLQVTPDYVLVDGHMPQLIDTPQRALVRGESESLSIACASIIAKVTRDRLMTFYDRLFPAYGFAQHKGYGTALHHDRLRQHGPSPLHRTSFRPVRELVP